MNNLNEMTVKELKELGKQNHVKGWWKLNKAQLIEALEQPQPKMAFKDECDGCGEFAQLSNYNGKLLCGDCITKAEEKTVETEEVETVEEETEEVETKVKEVEEVEEVKEVTEPKTNKVKSGKQLFEYNGKSQNLSSWAKELNMSLNTLYTRIHYKGMSFEEAVTTPIKEQKRNKELIEYNGKSQTISAWSRELGININTLYSRIYYKGMTFEEAINAPIKNQKQIEYNGKSQNLVAWARELGININTLYSRIYYKGMTMEEAINTPIKRSKKDAE